MIDECCSCHINPPCAFCVSLTEEEAEIFMNQGMEALKKFRLENEE